MPGVILMATDTNNNPLTFSAVNLPPGLMLTASTISGTIASGTNFSSPYLVTATATDTVTLESDSHDFYWYVGQNQPTVTLMNPGNQSSHDGETLSLPVMGTDSACNPLTYSAVNLPTGLTINAATGQISGKVAPFADFEGPFDVSVTATDTVTGLSTAQPFIWDVSYAPSLADQYLQVSHDQSITIDLSASVSNADPAQLQFTTIVSPQMVGTLEPMIDGIHWVYTPPVDFVGAIYFGVEATDGLTTTNIGMVNIAVLNAAPVARDVWYKVDAVQATTIAADKGLLQQVYDADDVPALEVVTPPSNDDGVVAIQLDGGFTFTPGANFQGDTSFVIRFDDGNAEVQATVHLAAGLIARDDYYKVVHDQALIVGGMDANMPGGFLVNDEMPEGALEDASFGVVYVRQVTHGILTPCLNGTFTYSPNPGYVGVDWLQYRLVLGNQTSNLATVSLYVTNNAPTAIASIYPSTSSTLLIINAADGVLRNSVDLDGDLVAAQLVRGPTPVLYFSLSPDGSFTFMPIPGMTGVATFVFR
ncbi:MAG: tandem-95 repeat protein, partial [Planctomycetes bacterium]|nr:tandem-95 repeat protein [Planctomycetota bacterium]